MKNYKSIKLDNFSNSIGILENGTSPIGKKFLIKMNVNQCIK